MTEAHKVRLYHTIFIVVVLLAVYASTLNHGFVWDDTDVIVGNPSLDSFRNIPAFFFSGTTVDATTGYYRPVTYVSFLIDRTIWGLNPTGFNATNLLLHIAVSLTLYLLVWELFRKERYAFIVAMVFALHPIANETVNFHAGGRNTLLCALFALLSFFWYARKRLPASVLCFTLAIFSKEFALLMPALFLLYDRYLADEKRPWKNYVPYAAMIVVYLAIRSYTVAAPNFLNQLRAENLLRLTPHLVIAYLANMLLPLRLKTMYEIKAVTNVVHIVPYLLILAAISISAICSRKKELVTATGWFLLFMGPVCGVLPLGITPMADRYAYFSSMGFAMALAYFVNLANLRAVVVIAALLCGWYASIDLQRNSYWKDEFTLFNQMIKDAPHQAIGFQNLGLAYHEKGDLDNAVKCLAMAYTKEGGTAQMLAGSATVFWQAKQFDKAKVALSLAGEKLLEKHDLELAERRLKEALGIDPDFVPALVDMGSLYAEKGDYTRALEYFSRAGSLDSSNPSVHYNLSVTYEALGENAKAREEMDKFKEFQGSASSGRR